MCVCVALVNVSVAAPRPLAQAKSRTHAVPSARAGKSSRVQWLHRTYHQNNTCVQWLHRAYRQKIRVSIDCIGHIDKSPVTHIRGCPPGPRSQRDPDSYRNGPSCRTPQWWLSSRLFVRRLCVSICGACAMCRGDGSRILDIALQPRKSFVRGSSWIKSVVRR